MGRLSQRLERLGRIPARCRRDLWLIRRLGNWREALGAEWHRKPLRHVKLRNGIVLDAPDTIDLAFLFQETWLRRIYNPPGYEIGCGETVIDIGANIGVFAIHAATCAPNVKVYAYEPFPENVTWLRRNVSNSRLTNVQVQQKAVCADTGTRYLHVNSQDWIMHSLFSNAIEGKGGLPVECISFDELMDTESIEQCHLLKLDCEGSEYEILKRSSPKMLKRVRRIVGEYHEGSHIEGTGKELCNFLESRSFCIDRFESHDVGCGIICARNLFV